jgi:hypothetical protein
LEEVEPAATDEMEEEEEKEAKNPSDDGLSGGFGIRSIYVQLVLLFRSGKCFLVQSNASPLVSFND